MASPTDGSAQIVAEVMSLLIPHRRALQNDIHPTPTASDFPHIVSAIHAALALRKEITFVLPGFPCKSPNPEKVLGTLPDEGERASLLFLNQLCARIRCVYPAGARLIICSDGHIFADAIGVDDHTVDQYLDALARMIRDEELECLELFSLRNIYSRYFHEVDRLAVIDQYAPHIAELRSQVKIDRNLATLYRGLVRFLAADTDPSYGTRSAIQRQSRHRAYQVLQRSIAWGNLINEHFPGTVRLSIHPQPRDSIKFGLRLLSSDSMWTTPWHSIPLKTREGEVILVRNDQLPAGARLKKRWGHPDHYELV
jgi:pyoverdine/dityrosine biosynthesis protein Dit1